MHRTTSKRSGFTLIELLLVIAIIAILATVMLPLVRGAMNAQKKATATGAIAALSGACERYRKLYGDFPCARTGTPLTYTADQPNYRQDLYLQLTGQRRLRSTALAGGGVGLDLYTVPAGSERPLVTPELVEACTAIGDVPSPISITGCTEFMDPWGNAYDYRYRVLNAATASATVAPYTTWLSPEFLLVSCGAKYKEGTLKHVPPRVLFRRLSVLQDVPSLWIRGVMLTTTATASSMPLPPAQRSRLIRLGYLLNSLS